MDGRVKCPRCQKASSVRVEVLMKADHTQRQYDCAACGHRWKVDSHETVASRDDK